MNLPTVSGYNLQRQRRTFPADFSGKYNLVFIAFKQWQQKEVDSWAPFVETLCERFPTLAYYEFPVLPESSTLYRFFLNEGMRAGIPDPTVRAQTITLYIDKAAFKQTLDIPDEEHMWLYLFDQEGNTVLRVQGRYTVEKFLNIEAVLSRNLMAIIR